MKSSRPKDAADVYVVLPGGFAEKPENGLVISVLRRVRVLADRGLRIDIVSFPFAFDFARRSSRVLADFKLIPNVRFRNVYAELVDFDHGAPFLDPLPSGSGWSTEEDSTDDRVRRVYFEGRYERFAYTGLDGLTIFADVLSGGKRSRREWYAPNGRVSKIENFNSLNIRQSSSYFDAEGSIRLTSEYDPTEKTDTNFRYFERNCEVRDFRTLFDLEAWWLAERVIFDGAWSPVIAEYGFKRRLLDTVAKSRNISVAYALHSSHMGPPYQYDSPLKPELKPFVESLDMHDAVVVPTIEQKFDLVRRFPSNDNVFVIPHHFDRPKVSVKREPRTAVMISRIVRTKGHFDALDAWRIVVKKYPEALLNIFGSGPDEEAFKAAVEDAGLGGNIRLHGFSEEAVSRLAESEVALFPSSYEGFSLALLEAMALGTVPVAYDFRYGARAMIEHGASGLIVTPSHVRELADSVLYLFDHPAELSRMSISAIHGSQGFNAQRLGDEWLELFRVLEHRFAERCRSS